MGQHGSASGSALLGLDGFEVVSAELVDGEWQLVVQTTATMVGCAGCDVPAKPHGRREVRLRDLPIGGRPVVLAWCKRLWRCHEPAWRAHLDRADAGDPPAGGADQPGPPLRRAGGSANTPKRSPWSHVTSGSAGRW